jgi:hypothetical protein
MTVGALHPDWLPRPESSAVEAAAMSRLHDYLRRAQPVSEHDELIARDAYMAGFAVGGRWALVTSGRLARSDVQQAITVLAELMQAAEA